jgi:zinc D-Ala-D-Ala carboxypeptidase
MKDFKISEHFSFLELTNSHDHPELLELNREYFSKEPYLSRLTVFAESVLEEIRYAVDAPVIVNSCGRCPELNAAVGGVETSQHKFDTPTDGASDITVKNQAPVTVAFKIFNQGIRFFQMRVYETSNFTHIGSPRQKNNGQIAFPESTIPGWAK